MIEKRRASLVETMTLMALDSEARLVLIPGSATFWLYDIGYIT